MFYLKNKNIKHLFYNYDSKYSRPLSLQQVSNHFFKGPILWSRELLPFYRKKLDRSTQFRAVGYIITLYSSKAM